MPTYSRRRFLGALGAGAVATAGLARPAAAETPVVEMRNDYFDPVGLYVEPGTTVRFRVAAGAHSATAYEDRIPAGATPFDSGVRSSGGFEHTFEESGTYDYYCIPHERVGMMGRVVVGRPGGPAESEPVPHGELPDGETVVDRGVVAAESGGGGGGGHAMDHRMGGGMPGRSPRGVGGLPVVGGALALLGAAGGALYLALRRGVADEGEDAARRALQRRYGRGDIDEDEFERRRERLTDDEG